MKKATLLFILIFTTAIFSQEEIETVFEPKQDSITYNKNTNYVKRRKFTEDLNDKYSGDAYTYTEEKKEKKKEEIKPHRIKPPKIDFNGFSKFLSFMNTIFPFILGGVVIFIILKLYLGADIKFWTFKRTSKKITKTLIYEDEDINNSDLEGLLKRALKNKDTRLAIRYYYLILLKKLSDKEIIKYDKDKTNSDYLFEIEDVEKRNQFSYLSYIYSYVWYGEFDLNEQDFIKVEEKYNSFLKTIN